MEYRKHPGRDIWHFCENCSQWPIFDYRSSYIKPTHGEVCDECLSKMKKGECEC